MTVLFKYNSIQKLVYVDNTITLVYNRATLLYSSKKLETNKHSHLYTQRLFLCIIIVQYTQLIPLNGGPYVAPWRF